MSTPIENKSKKQKVSMGALKFALRGNVLKRNLTVALGVGCLLSLANQLDVIRDQPFTLRIGLKIFFNFLIPFLVSSASAAMNRKCD